MSIHPTQMMRAKCLNCTTVFDVAAIPMSASLWAKIAMSRGKYCPMCGSTKTVTADPRPITQGELRTIKEKHPEPISDAKPIPGSWRE